MTGPCFFAVEALSVKMLFHLGTLSQDERHIFRRSLLQRVLSDLTATMVASIISECYFTILFSMDKLCYMAPVRKRCNSSNSHSREEKVIGSFRKLPA